MTPLVSVCIPAYNCSSFVSDTLQSVLQQNFQNYEVIIQENASKDETLRLIEAFLNKSGDSRFRLFKNEKTLSVEANWNLSIQKARGEYIKLLCADDLLDPDCLKQQASILQDPGCKNVVMTSVQRRIIGPQNNVLLKTWKLQKMSGIIPGSELIRHCARWGTNVIGESCTVLMRASAFRKTSGFRIDIPYMIDLDLWVQLLEQGDAYISPEVLCSFRISADSWTTRIANQHAQQARAFVKNLRQRYPRYVRRSDAIQGWLSGTALGFLRACFISLNRG